MVSKVNPSEEASGTDIAGRDLLSTAWKRSRPGLAIIAAFSVFINLLKLAVPLYILNILDRVISSGSLETLAMLTIIALIAVVCSVLLEVARRRMFMSWGKWIENLLSPYLFKAGMRSQSGNTTSASALRDLDTIKSFVSSSKIITWLDVVWAPLFVCVVFLVAPQLGYIILFACLIALALGTVNELATRDSRNATLKAGKANRTWLSVTERDPETAGSLNQINGLAELWSRDASERSREWIRTRFVNINFAAALLLVGRLVRISVFGIGIWFVITKTLSIGAVIAANVLGRMAYSLVSSAMLKWRDLMLTNRAYYQIKSTLKKYHVNHVSFPKSSTLPSLVLEDISFRYPNQASSIFRRVNVSVQPGEILCLLGPSAAGKTTFCRLVSGIIPARSGKILFGDIDIYHFQKNSPIREIGYLPQEYSLFHASVRENIAGNPYNNLKLVVRAAKLTGIHDMILKLPQGYDTEIIDRDPHLSAGQRKAIVIARTFYGLPSLVVLDEPFANLDSKLQISLVRGLLKMRKHGGIIVMSSQDLPSARLADKIIVFENGKHSLLNTREQFDDLQKQIITSDSWEILHKMKKQDPSVSNISSIRSL